MVFVGEQETQVLKITGNSSKSITIIKIDIPRQSDQEVTRFRQLLDVLLIEL